ncbi:MAG: membrane protein insertase YidC [Candidatus Tantalella remota]|nr:membrane protein insertase YidC [Candidatus Tantalella remota]
MEKRMIAAIALSLLILLGFQMMKPKPAPVVVSQTQEFSGQQGQTHATQQEGPLPVSTTPLGAVGAVQQSPVQEELTEVTLDNARMVFSNVGGSLKELYLLRNGSEGTEEQLFDIATPELRPFTVTIPAASGMERNKFILQRMGNGLKYSFSVPGSIEVTKTYTVDPALNQIGMELSIKNLSGKNTAFAYQMVGPSNLTEAGKVAGRNFLMAYTMIDGELWKAKPSKNIQAKTGKISWTALKNRYFAVILKPITPPDTATVLTANKNEMETVLTSAQVTLSPGETLSEKYIMYAGALDSKKIAALGADMQGIIDYGFFGVVSKALLAVLRFFNVGVKNWGVSIILLTILINIILFPLTLKSFSSMHQMKAIQPHIQKLKDIHKDNPQKLNKEMMELYKQYNVNPIGGCLPMLLQMPIFIALYQGLMRSVELKGSSFLWIKDLSKPDAVPLPFTLPFLGNHLNILPLLMVGMMVVQQKISSGAGGAMTDEQASQQKMMMLMMPLFFGFLFYKMPSGLVLYWLTNTILMTVEQTAISRRMMNKG